MDEKVLKLLERAIAENLSNERVSYIMGVNGYEQSAIDAALGELKKKRPSQEPASQQASAQTASTASPIVPKPERTPSDLRGSEPALPQFFQEKYGAKPAELPIPQKPGPQIEYVEDKKGNVVARDRRTGEVTYSDTPSLSPEARKNIQERVLSGQVQTAPVQVPTSEVTAADWFGDKWNGLIEGLETFASNVRDEHSSNGQAIADFIEDKKQDKPELYQLYEKSLSDSKERGYSDEFARGLAANAAYTQFYQKDRSIENEILPYIRQKGRDVAIDKFGVEIDEKVQKELKDRFFSGAVRGLSSSLPAMAASASTMGMSFFDMAYNGAEEQLAIQLNENPELQMSKAEQETYKITVAGIEGILEKVGLGNTLKGNPMLKRALAGKVLTRLAGLGEDAGAEAFEKIVKEEARGLGGYVRKVAAGAMSEFETGALQQLSNDLINQYVTDSQGQNVFQPKTAKEIIKDVLYAGAQEAVGGGIISGTIGAFQKPGLDMTKEEFDNGINFAQNIKVERVNEFLNEQVAAGQITEEQAASTLNRVQEFKDAAAKIPEELTDDAKYQIFQLIAQKQGLQKNAAGKDEAIQERVKQKVDAINQQIQEVYDSQTQQSVSGTVQEGEIIGQVFQPGTSTEKTSPSGVLQAPQAEVDLQFYAPAFTVDPLGRAVVSPEKDNSVVSSIGNVRPTQEVTEDDASELNRVFNVAKNAVPEGTKVVVHNSLESLLNSNPKAAQLYVDGKGTAKAYWNSTSNEFHVLSRGAVEQYNAATGGDISYAKQYVHEVVHPILNTLINEDAEVQSRLFTEIESMAKGGNTVAQRAMNFGRKYAEKKQQNETVTEFFALMAQPDALKSFDKNFKQRIKDFFNELFVRLGMDIKLDTDQDLYTMARNIDLATRTGTAIVFPKTNAAYQARSIQASLDSTPAGSRLFNEPLAGVEEIVQEYVTKNNIPYRKGKRIFTIDKERAKAIGQAYDVMRHEPSNPEVKRSYEALAKETLAQHQLILEKGYEVEINNEEPYNNSAEMIADLRDNKRMRIFSTEAGFGDEPITDDQRAENPMLRDSGYRDVNGNVLLVNDVFRFVHDFFGHAERGNSFGPVGEENAWDAHSRMYTNLARKAMTSETRGQNSWVNFSGVNDEAFKLRDKARKLRADGRTDEASKLVSQVYEMMRFAEQKNGLLPDAFVANDYDELEFSMDEKTVDIRDGAASVRFVNANKTFVKQREIVYAERVLEKNPMFMFTGTEKIESAEDVAYLFRHLESAVSENAFVTFSNPKNGEFRVQWLGTGGTTAAVIDTKQILAAYQNFAEDLGTTELSVTLVHNHPSGTLAASEADVKMLKELRGAFKLTDAKIEDGVIINLDSGKFVVFNDLSSVRASKVTTQEIPYDVFSFNRQVLYTPSSEVAKITSLNDVGQFLSKFKRGRHEKLGYFVMNQQNKITYAAIMDPNKTVADAARELSSDVGRYGEAVIIFGTDKTRVGALKDKASSSLSSFNANILDTVVITDSEEYLEFESRQFGGTSTFQKSGITGEIDFSLDEEFSVSDEVNISAEPKGNPNLNDLSFSIDEKVKRHKGRGKTANGKLEDFAGRKMHVTFSDRMVGGFVDGEEYLGGVYFPAITNSVWGANSVGAANKIVKAAVKNPDGYRYVVVAMMNPDSHMSNKNMSAKALKEIERELSSSRVTVEEGYDRIMKAFSKKDLNERFGPIVESYKAKRQTKGNLIKLIEETVMADATFDLRRSFLETVLGKADKNLKLRFGNLPSYGTLAQMLAEPVTRGMEVGDTSFIIRTKGDLSVATPDPKDPDYHPSYKNVVRSTEDVELVFIDQVYNVVDMFPRIEAKNLGHEEYKNAYGKNWRTRYLMYMGLGKMSTTVSDELVVPEQQIELSVDEASNLRQTISRTVNRFNPETRARIMANPDSYYTKQSLKTIKGNLENMSDDELLENMTAEGLNTVSRTAAVGKGENDISVLAAVELINRKVANGEDVSELLVDLAQLGTTVGRMLRHFAELKSSSPVGIVETVRAALKRADRVMTATQEQKLTSIAERFIAAQQKVKALRDQIELVFDSATESELNNATKELDKVTRELNAFTSVIMPKKVMDLLSTTIQGNLLTPMSQITNVGANAVQILTSIPVKGFETLFSKITSVFTGRQPRSFSASVMALPYAIKQAGVGTLEALQIIIRGGASTDKIVHSGFMPAASLLAALSDTKFASMVNSTFGKEVIKSDVLPRLANGNIAAADRAKALYEGLLGAAPEVMFRFLSLGDKPFFRFAEAMQLAQEANRLGLKGEARRNFLKYPTKKAMSTAEKAGKVLTFQQDNQAANIIFQLQKSIGSVPIIGKMLEFMFKVSLPYVKTPANIFSETMKFALPAYGVATATDKFFKKDYEGGSSDLAKAAVGQMILAAANYLIVNGIITAAFDDEDEGERAMMYLKQPPSSINKDALARLLNGESPEYKDGDRFARYDKLGIPGMVLGARANAVKRAGGKVNEEGLYVGEESMFKPMQAIWDQISMPVSTLQFMNEQSFLSGTNSLLNVLSGEASERDVEKWLENTFRSLTAIPFPNTLSAVHRGYREYMPNITTDNISNKFRYVVQDRMFDTDGVPVRVTPLGEKIPQTPEGANKFMYNLIDFTKSMKSSSDKVWGELYSVYKATEEPDVAPKFPTKLTRLPSETPGGDKIKGWNADVEREWRLEMQRIQEIHGKGKMELLENLFQSNSYNQADNEQRAKMIVDLYNDYNRGRRTIKSPFGRMPSLKPRFEWKLEYEKVEQKFLD